MYIINAKQRNQLKFVLPIFKSYLSMWEVFVLYETGPAQRDTEKSPTESFAYMI